MAAGVYDFTVEQGATFQRVLTWLDDSSAPVNLSGYTARMMFRPTYADLDIPTPVLSLTSPSGGITLGGSAGTITIVITAAQTAALPVPTVTVEADHHYVYDLELQSGAGVVNRLLQGEVTISQEVTR